MIEDKCFFNVEYSYQLNVNDKHDMFYYIELSDKVAELKVYKVVNGYSENCLCYPLTFIPIASGWVKKNIFLQSEKNIVLFNVASKKIVKIPSASYKILDIVCLNEKYIYATNIDLDYIDFYKCKKDTLDKHLASYSFLKKHYTQCDISMSPQENFLIKAYINKIEMAKQKDSTDTLGKHKLKIKNEPIYSKLCLDNKDVLTVYGHIDRACFIGREIVFTLSSFVTPQKIFIVKLEDLENITKPSTFDFNILTEYYQSGELGVPHYILYLTKQRMGSIVMIHGGPAEHFSNQYNPILLRLLLMGFTIYLINYTGSTGYGNEFKQKLYGNGGNYDYIDIYNSLNIISNKYSTNPIFVIGDSYGGYLAIVTLLKGNTDTVKFYATNAFTDIRYQYLFSRASSVIKKYFPEITSEEILERNPIDLARGKDLHSQLLVINGFNDYYCPPQQIYQFRNITNCEVKFLDDYPHFKVGYEEQWELSELIINDLRRILRA